MEPASPQHPTANDPNDGIINTDVVDPPTSSDISSEDPNPQAPASPTSIHTPHSEINDPTNFTPTTTEAAGSSDSASSRPTPIQSPSPEEKEEEEIALNWGFDDPLALREHCGDDLQLPPMDEPTPSNIALPESPLRDDTPVQEQALEQASEQEPEKAPEQTPSRADSPAPVQAPDQTHAEDPFEQLHRDAPERSSSFPPVPPIGRKDEEEDALMRMMASEVAAGEGERGPFDSPSKELFLSEDVEGGEDDFFSNQANGNTVDKEQEEELPNTMGQVGMNGGEVQQDEPDAEDARFEEGIPLVNHKRESQQSQLEVQSKDDIDFFSEQGDEGDDFFSNSLASSVRNSIIDDGSEHHFSSPVRKSTEQVLAGGGFDQEAEANGGADPADFFSSGGGAEDDFFGQIGQTASPEAATTPRQMPQEGTEQPTPDESAKWAAALADDEFLDDDSLLESDSESFLESDNEDATLQAPAISVSQPAGQPQQQQQYQPPAPAPAVNSYTPQPQVPAPQQPMLRNQSSGYFPPPAPQGTQYGGWNQPAPAAPPGPKPQSFVDKREGYHSPYDLPEDLVQPLRRKTSSLVNHAQHASHLQHPLQQQLTPPSALPPRSSSITAPNAPKPKPPVQKQQFFEDLPIAPQKPRPGSSTSRNPSNQGFAAPPLPRQVSSAQGHYATPPLFSPPVQNAPSLAPPSLAPPSLTPVPPTQPSRYSPNPVAMTRQASTGLYAPPPVAPAGKNRYSPAPTGPSAPVQATPPATGASSKYAPRPAGPPASVLPPVMPFSVPPAPPAQLPVAPATAPPPLAHPFSTPPTQSPQSTRQPSPESFRRQSGEHERQLHSSRPGTSNGIMEPPREEEEEEAVDGLAALPGAGHPPPARRESASSGRFAPPPLRAASTPPPPHKPIVSQVSSPDVLSPPPRAQTSSPGNFHGRIGTKQREPYERPLSALAHSSVPPAHPQPPTFVAASFVPPKQEAPQLNFLPPNDYTANDELKRWQGAPIVCWGFGGQAVTMFPARTQRFGADVLTGPVIKCSPGEVKIRSIDAIIPVPEDVKTFPGPIGKGAKRKKEVSAWMDNKIAAMEKAEFEIYDPEVKREHKEKTMLWKVVRCLLEHDGVLEGTPEIDAEVRKILVPEFAAGEGDSALATDSDMGPAPADTVDPEAVRTFRAKLLSGDKEAAIWYAADKRLWAHAFLIAGTMNPEMWKKVVVEFVKSEVKTLGRGSESLAVLYSTLAGNGEDAADELVPTNLRHGIPMFQRTEREETVEERLARWRETVAVLLSNRSPGDWVSLRSIGKLLMEYNHTSASHIAYIFARQTPLTTPGGSVFSGHDERLPNNELADFSLLSLSSASPLFGTTSAEGLDALHLSEIYEYALSLAPSSQNIVFPHLQIWKLYYAYYLAACGRLTQAQKYCDAIATAVKSYNRPSPYFHQAFGTSLEDLTKRLQQAPRDSSKEAGSTSGGWIPKLTSDKVGQSVWGAFNKFVSGEEPEVEAHGHGQYGRNTPAPPPPMMGPAGIIQGDVGNQYPPQPDMQGVYGMGAAPMYTPSVPNVQNGAESIYGNSASSRYAPTPANNPYQPQQAYTPGGGPQAHHFASPMTMNSSPAPYTPQPQIAINDEPQQQSGGYEPPSGGYGYEPPTTEFIPYQPEPESESDDEKEKKKKEVKKQKSFMDLDDEDAGGAHHRFGKSSPAPPAPQPAAVPSPTPVKEEKKPVVQEEKKDEQKDNRAGTQKKGWGITSWFSRSSTPDGQQSGPIKAKLGEESSFVYDPDLKRWVNKKAGTDTPAAAKPPPPPKRTSTPGGTGNNTPAPGSPAPPRSAAVTPPMTSSPAPPAPAQTGLAPPQGAASGPPSRGVSPAPPSMARSGSAAVGPPGPAGPSGPKKPVDPMEELLGPPGAGSGAGRARGRKKGGANRYVEVIPGQQ